MKGFNPSAQEIEDLAQRARAAWRRNPGEPPLPRTLAPEPPTSSDEKESVLQCRIVRWAREHGFPIQSNRSTPKARTLLTAGWPDVCLILRGRVVWVELKSGRGRLSEEQKQLRIAFMHLGHEIYECRTWKRFLEIVSGTETGERIPGANAVERSTPLREP